MKKVKILIIFMCFVSITCFVGCGNKKLEPATISRDDARTGGSLSFVYDQKDRMVYIGGEDEVVQYSQADETKDLTAGNRVGLKVTAPNEELDLSDATLQMNGINYSSGDFLETVNGQKQRFFNIYPMFNKKDRLVEFSIVWQDGTQKQTYKVKIVDGTKFMKEDGTVE